MAVKINLFEMITNTTIIIGKVAKIVLFKIARQIVPNFDLLY